MLTPHCDMVQAEGAWLSPRTRRSFRWRSAVKTTQGGNPFLYAQFLKYSYSMDIESPKCTFPGNDGASKIMTLVRRSTDRT